LKDGHGNIYKIPNFCLNDPYFEKVITNEAQRSRISNMIQIFLYDLYDNNKIAVRVYDDITGSELKSFYCALVNIDQEKYKIRLIFSGCEIFDDTKLYKYNIKENYTIQIMKTEFP
jgi:hypothetical protein